MKIKISGKAGYLGTLISAELEKQNHIVSGFSRDDLYAPIEKLAEKISGTDVIINLSGATILQRWTTKNKQTIYESRVKTTKNLVSAIIGLPKKLQPKKFISVSAIGIYKAGFMHDEMSTNFDDGFIGKVLKDWEKQSEDLPDDIQKVVFRVGIVLGKNSKTIKNLLLPFKLGLGAIIGSGKQPFPFVHEQDVARAFVWAVDEFNNSELFNLVAPERVNNEIFTKELARQLHRPALLFIPGFFLKLLYGKASVLLIESPEITSEKITKAGFEFKYPDINSALKEIV